MLQRTEDHHFAINYFSSVLILTKLIKHEKDKNQLALSAAATSQRVSFFKHKSPSYSKIRISLLQ